MSFVLMIWIQTCVEKNHSFFVNTGLCPNYVLYSKQMNWYQELLLNAEFQYCRIREGSCDILGFSDSDIP